MMVRTRTRDQEEQLAAHVLVRAEKAEEGAQELQHPLAEQEAQALQVSVQR